MKKSLFFILAASLLMAVSCNKKADPEPEKFKTLSVTAETEAQLAVAWKSGDVISVNGTFSEALADDVEAGAPAQFKIAKDVAAPYNVIYPPVPGDKVTIPSMQKYSAGRYDPAAAILIGYATGESVVVKHACAFLKVNVARAEEEVIDKLSLTAVGEEALSGVFQADCSAGTLTYVSGASKVDTISSVAFDEAGKIQAVFVIPAGTYQSGFSIMAIDAEGEEIGTSEFSETGITLQAGKMVDVPEITFTPASKKFSGGEGTEAKPYIIGKAEDLVELSNLCNDVATNPEYHAAFYKQSKDIDLAGVDFKAICSAYKDATAFAGVYDGCGHKVSNIVINGELDTQGLFGYIRGGKIKNVTMENCSITGTKRLGVLVGTAWLKSEVSGCKVINSTVHSASSNLVGGIVGYCNGSTVSDCEAVGCTLSSDADYAVGAIVGELYNNGTITGCTTSGCTVSAVQCAGGIAGRAYGGLISKCEVKGKTTITTTERAAGGITGGISAKSTVTSEDLVIDNCLVSGGTSVKAQYYSGGIAGYIYPGAGLKVKIMNCGLEDSFVGTKMDDGSGHKGDCCIGGIVGWVRNSSANSEFKILNNYIYYAEGGCRVDEEGITNLAIAGVVGYISNSATSTLEIGGNCTDIAKSDIVVAGKPYSGEDPEASKIGAVYGHCAHNYNTMNFSKNYWVNDTGILSIGHGGLTNVVIADNEGFTTPAFTDGATVVAKLNAFATGYTGETLNAWTVKNNRPVLVFNF